MNLAIVAVTVFGAMLLLAWLALKASERFMRRYRENFMEQARLNLADMFLFMDPTQLFVTNGVALVVLSGLVWILTGKLIFAVITAALLMFLPRRVYEWMKKKRIEKIQSQLPDALQMLAGSLRAGVGFSPALEVLVHDGQPPLAQEFALVLREQHLGVRAEEALEHFGERVPIMDAKLFVSAVNISREVGGNLGETLSTLAETLRRRLIMENKVKALTAQGRLQGIVMACLPVFLIGYLSFMYSETMRPMFHAWHGWAVLAIGCVMEYLGYRMCRKIMSIDV